MNANYEIISYCLATQAKGWGCKSAS